jgi:hypothetical protein
VFDCETCPVRAWQARLDEDDRLALDLFRQLTLPGVQEMGLVPVVFEAAGVTMTRAEARGLVARLSVLYQHAASQQAARLPMRD